MATITMPMSVDAALSQMCTTAMADAVSKLSAKYGFDAEEASRFLDLGSVKIARKRGPSPKKESEKPEKPKKLTKKEVKKAEKEAKKAEKAAKPKRAPTGYLMYSNEHRAEVKAELEAALGDGEKLKPQDTVKRLAADWKELSKEEQAVWKLKAAESVSQTASEAESEPEPEPEPEPEVAPEEDGSDDESLALSDSE